MNLSYLRVRRPLKDALEQFHAWIGVPEIEPAREVPERESIDLALEGEDWKGLAVFIFPWGAWTVFQELSGGLGGRGAADWLRLADGGDLVYAGYNDAAGFGELVYITGGELVRHFVQDDDDPSAGVNVGRLREEAKEPWSTWIDMAGWVDTDDEVIGTRDRGLLWIHEVPPGTWDKA